MNKTITAQLNKSEHNITNQINRKHMSHKQHVAIWDPEELGSSANPHLQGFTQICCLAKRDTIKL